jgi:hypothetical protein
MRILDRFRKDKKDVLPEEVEKYYQSQRRARIGTAWMLGFFTLVVTLVISLGLFYGVRYAYRQVSGPNDTTTEVTLPDAEKTDPGSPDKPTRGSSSSSAPRTGDSLPANGDTSLPATGDPGL